MTEQTSQIAEIAEPKTGSRRILADGAISISWVVVVACVHLMYVGFMQYGSKPRTASVLATLTQNGRQWYFPERELPIYVIGCVLALFFSLTAAYTWLRTARERDRHDPGFALRGCLFGLMLAALASGFNLSWLLGIRIVGKTFSIPRFPTTIVLIAPAVVELVLLYASQRQNPTGRMHGLIAQVESELKAVANRVRSVDPARPRAVDQSTGKQRIVYRLIDIAILLFVCIVIYIPRTDLLAGRDYVFQHFHHWDFFAMGPAIGLLKGKHLATQVYCQYGFGWPLLLAKLNPILTLTYSHAYKVAVTYGCLYYCGLYLLLRRLLTNPAFAIAGLMLALRLQVFHSGQLDIPLWCIPATSILRTPCDIWVFLLMAEHWRSQRPQLLLAAGALVGAAILFVIDTGVYLAMTFVVYNVLWLASQMKLGPPRQEDNSAASATAKIPWIRMRLSLAAFVLAALVLITGLAAASGSAVFSTGYIHQWLEVLWLYPSGISMLPMIQETAGFVFSYWFTLMFLAQISTSAFKSSYRRAEDVLIPCMAVLGLLYLIYYIGNSHAYSMFQLSTPFCIVAAYTVERITATLCGPSMRFGNSRKSIISVATALTVTTILFLNPQFRGYPNLINSIFRPAPLAIECYSPELRDVCIAAHHDSDIAEFQLVAAEMRSLTNQGKTIAVIANDDTPLYVASRATLWNRYSPLLPALMTQSMLAEVNRDLSTKPVDFVFLKKRDPTKDGFWAGMLPPKTTDSWMMLSHTTRGLYHFDHDCGTYEVWRR